MNVPILYLSFIVGILFRVFVVGAGGMLDICFSWLGIFGMFYLTFMWIYNLSVVKWFTNRYDSLEEEF